MTFLVTLIRRVKIIGLYKNEIYLLLYIKQTCLSKKSSIPLVSEANCRQ
jgi:hypothetical protein